VIVIVVRKAFCLLLVGALLSVSVPRAALAASPEAERVQLELVRLGISADEAAARVAALDESELDTLARELDEQPAGQGAFETALIAAGAVFILLVILDATGVTDIFPWINKPNRR
jgi:hypothetical protein